MSSYLVETVETIQFNAFDQRCFVVTQNTTPFEIKRITPQSGETGTILIRYNACDNTTPKPLTANRYKLVRFIKTFAGACSVENVTNLYSNNSNGFGTSQVPIDVTVTASGGDLVFAVQGAANLVMHTMRTEILSGVLD